ncbi:MAG: phosphoribosyltransferase family protein [Candidatus Aenigmarchaeota archaeon]|nr:phosphoribosyltransferase family protein [Candidatus Aenigmarchaeota archaeon]
MKLIEDPKLRNKKRIFENREQAGLLLAEKLKRYSNEDAIVLAIPAGGVPVGKVIAEKLKVKFDLMVVRKIQFPDNPEAGFGAISHDGEIVFNQNLMKQSFLTKEIIDEQIKKTKKEIERRVKLFCRERRFPELKGKIVILVDDGLASGYTMLVAIRSVKKQKPRRIIVAVPTGNSGAINLVGKEADEVYCLNVRDEFYFAVADAYVEWYDLSNREVLELLRK